jgi:tetratricopeptide (TPR) repeat protein
MLYQAAVLSRRGRADPTVQYERAFRLSPRDPAIALSLAAAYRNAGRFDEALQMYDLTIALQPDSAVPYYAKALLLTRWLGDTLRARAVLEQARAHAVLEQVRATAIVGDSVVALEIYLDTLDRRYDEARSRLADIRSEAFLDHYSRDLPKSLLAAQVASLAGDEEAAREGYREAVTLLEAGLREDSDSWRTRRPLAIAYAGLGRRDDAVREAREAVASLTETRPGLALAYAKSDLALVYAMVGEDDPAIDILTELTRISYSPVMPAVLRIDPQWDSLRDHPRFRELLDQS